MLALIAKYLGPRAFKALAGGVMTTGMFGAMTAGFETALMPYGTELGAMFGDLIGGLILALVSFLVGHIPVYQIPNKKT